MGEILEDLSVAMKSDLAAVRLGPRENQKLHNASRIGPGSVHFHFNRGAEVGDHLGHKG